MIQKLGGRKFLVTLGVMGAGVAIDLLTEKGLSDNVMYLLFGASTGFGVVNVGKYALNLKDKQAQIELQPVVDLTPVLEAVEGLRSKRAKGGTPKVDLTPLNRQLEGIVKLIEEKTKPGQDAEKAMTAIQAILNQNAVISDLLKQQGQLAVQTHQTLMSLLTPQKS